MNKDIINKIITAGMAAPSADNSQPWIFTHEDNSINIYIDKMRSGKLSDTRYFLSDIAIGCVVENMLIQASHLGFKGKPRYFPLTEEHSPLFPIKIDFEKTQTTETIPQETIYIRHTDRTFPWKGPIKDSVKQKLSMEVQAVNGARLLWLNSEKYKSG